MKQLFATIVLFIFVLNQSFSQGCFPDVAYASEDFGLFPPTAFDMDCGGTSSTKTFINLTDTLISFEIVPGNPQPVTMYIDAARITAISNLPTGLEVTTDVINSATVESPYGAWLNGGNVPNQNPAIGCISITGSSLAWQNASASGPNNDGVFTLVIDIDTRIAASDPDLSSIIQNGSWMSSVPASLGGGVFQIEIELRVNESGCVGGQLFAFPEVTSDNASTQTCDGEATVEVYNGIPPYSFVFSNGSSGQTAIDLCAGVYSIEVTDAVGSQSVTQFAIASSENVYSNVGPSVQNGIDTLYTYYNGCDLDYTLPLDSFYITNAITAGPDTCIVTWVAWQQGQPFTLTTYYPFLGPDPTVFSLVLWCQNGRSEAGVFQLFEYLDLSVGVEDAVAASTFLVSPNPSTGKFILEFERAESGLLEVIDMNGKLIRQIKLINSHNWLLDLSNEPDGVFAIKLLSEQGLGYARIVKL